MRQRKKNRKHTTKPGKNKSCNTWHGVCSTLEKTKKQNKNKKHKSFVHLQVRWPHLKKAGDDQFYPSRYRTRSNRAWRPRDWASRCDIVKWAALNEHPAPRHSPIPHPPPPELGPHGAELHVRLRRNLRFFPHLHNRVRQLALDNDAHVSVWLFSVGWFWRRSRCETEDYGVRTVRRKSTVGAEPLKKKWPKGTPVTELRLHKKKIN